MNLILTWLLLLLIGSKFESNDEQLTYASQILDLKFDTVLFDNMNVKNLKIELWLLITL